MVPQRPRPGWPCLAEGRLVAATSAAEDGVDEPLVAAWRRVCEYAPGVPAAVAPATVAPRRREPTQRPRPRREGDFRVRSGPRGRCTRWNDRGGRGDVAAGRLPRQGRSREHGVRAGGSAAVARSRIARTNRADAVAVQGQKRSDEVAFQGGVPGSVTWFDSNTAQAGLRDAGEFLAARAAPPAIS